MSEIKRIYKRYLPFFIFFAVLLLDRVTKTWACEHCIMEKKITSWLSCYLTFNRGVAWGMASSWSGFAFYMVIAAIALALTAFFAFIYMRVRAGFWVILETLAFAGAFSNFLDRILFSGHVIDFINVHYAGYSFPIFNIADCAISIGIGILLIKIIGEK